MAYTVDTLQINITSNSTAAVSAVDKLAGALGRLRDSAKNMSTLGTAAKNLQAAADVARKIDDTSAGKLSQFVASLAGLKSLDGVKLSSSIGNQIQNIGEAAKSLNTVDFSGIGRMTEAVSTLGAIENPTGLRSTVTQLKHIPEIIESLDDDTITSFGGKMQSVAEAVRPLATEMQRVSAGFSSFPTRIQRLIQENDRLVSSNETAGRSFGSLGDVLRSTQARLGIYAVAFRQLAHIMGNWLTESNAYVENLNLFTVTMGEAADEALAYAETVKEAVGIDPSDWIRNQGMFKQITSGFGVVEDKANLMSKNLTQLGYDISSFYNISIEESMQKLQSAISGELEPVRRLGYAIDVATLQQVAYAHGITQSVNSMNQAQKSQLRYVALMEQSSNVMGDMARTVQTPANAMRILGQELTQLARAAGNLLIPALQRIIPVAIAIVEILTEVVQAIANLFGFQLPTIDYSGLGDVTAGAEETADAIGGASKAAKEFKRQLIGIDELTILQMPDDAGRGGGAGGGLSSDDLGLDLPWYDFLEGLDESVNNVKATLKPILGIAAAIGAAFLAWKLKDQLLTGLGKVSGYIDRITAKGPITLADKGSIGALPQIIGGLATVAALLFAAWKNSDNFRDGCKAMWDTAKKAFKGIAGLAGEVVEITAEMVGVTDEALAALTSGEGLVAAAGGAAIAVGTLATALGAPIFGAIVATGGAIVLSFQAIGDAAKDGYEGLSGLDKELGAAAKSAAAFGLAGAIAFGPVGGLIAAGVAGIVAFAASMSTDAVQAVEIFDDTISEATREKVEPFLEKMRELDDTFVTMELTGIEVSDETVSSINSQLDSIVEMIVSELDANQNEALATLDPLKNVLGEEAYAEILAASGNYYEEAKKQAENGKKDINNIVQQAAAEHRAIEEGEWAQIYSIQSQMQELGLKNLSQSEIEYETIMRNLKDNATRVSLEQASEIIKNAQTTRDETIAAAENQYSAQLLEAQKMYDVNAISTEQYEAIKEAAALARESTINDANTQYQSIYDATMEKLGDTAKYIDSETGDIKTKWQMFTEDIATWWSESMDSIGNKVSETKEAIVNKAGEIKENVSSFFHETAENISSLWDQALTNVSQGWEDFKSYLSTGWHNFWANLGNGFISIWNGIISGLEYAVNFIVDGLNSIRFSIPNWSWLGSLAGKSFGFNLGHVRLGRVGSISLYEGGGFPSQGELFIANEAGPELVGQIGNRTAVANNDQITQGIAAGVGEANEDMINALWAAAQQIIRAIEDKDSNTYLDGRKVTQDITNMQDSRARMLGKAPAYI